MKSKLAWMTVAAAMALPGAASAAGNINVFLGSKTLDENDWYANEQAETGVLIDFAPAEEFPINFAIDFLASEGDELIATYLSTTGGYFPVMVKEEVETTELNLGVRKYWGSGSNLQPYFGGGISFVQLDAKLSISGMGSVTDEGEGTGIWLNGGIVWTIENFNIGFDLRYSAAEVKMDLGDYEGGGGHAGLLLGYHW